MIKIIDKSKCCGCTACYNICPKNCIKIEEDFEGFSYPIVDERNCINCGLCESVCLFHQNFCSKTKVPEAVSLINSDDNDRMKSSSGGAFCLIANLFLKNNGVVYGCSLDDENVAKHIRIESVLDIEKLQGSKYVQSSLDHIFNMVKQDLEFERMVLFSGTPCQINGLKLYLKKEYNNLTTIDVICHGVPSPLLWKKYVEELESNCKGHIKNVSFRDKKLGWHKFSFSYDSGNNSRSRDLTLDPYLRLFLKNYSLRPSCYNCYAKKSDSKSDLTLADFWGIERIMPDFDDDRGVSLVLIHTSKGNTIINNIKQHTIIRNVLYEEAIKYNNSYFKSATLPTLRKYFFVDLNKKGIKATINRYLSKSIFYKLYRYLKKHQK